MKHFDLDEIPEIQKVGVYAIRNKINDKYYIGSTTNLYHRFSLYFRDFNKNLGINRKMCDDFNKFGHSNFEIIVIEEFLDNELTSKELRDIEWKYIKQYKAIENGYNTCRPNIGNIPANQKLKSKDYMSEQRKNSFVFFVPKSSKSCYKQIADAAGLSLAELIRQAVNEFAERRQIDVEQT